ncbi:hypothetical protein GOBAR_AA22994 [Gossypium barbadense]|uniref:DUF4220 domain-containing protein n=1 Tax=Gossypium barbadense TaxID=3634 RepID=A0A2P5X2Y3_GOSBA|nr:hypothetical protein GOBAR_AA22994 [Gossypium barbadense]
MANSILLMTLEFLPQWYSPSLCHMFNSSCKCSTVRRDQGCCISEIDVEGDGNALAEWELRVMVVLSLTVQLILLALSHTMIDGLDISSGSVSSGVALYIYVKFWTLAAPTMLILAIPIFIVGIIKYGERVWALFQASKMGMEFQSSDKGSQLEVELSQGASGGDMTLEEFLDQKQIKYKYRYLYHFQVLKPMFSDLKLRTYC